MKSKLLIVAFIAILLCSALNVALTMAECPTCHGTGKVVCSYCDGTGEITIEEGEPCFYCSGSGILEPTLTLTSRSTWLSDGKVFVQVKYRNEEDVSTYGRVTAGVEVQTNTYTATSSDTTFPPNEETQITFSIDGISSADYSKLQAQQIFSTQITLEAEDVTCPHCDGTGLAPSTIECPSCGGLGVVTGEQDGEMDIAGTVYGVAAVAVVAGVAIAAFVVVKKRSVKEGDLRKLPPSEFQNWVLKRLGGKSSSSGDARMGIDGYTLEGQPVSIKQADDVGRNVIENFAAAMGRRQAKDGMIVAFSFGTDAIRGRIRAKMSYGLEIQMVTVKELIEGRNIPL